MHVSSVPCWFYNDTLLCSCFLCFFGKALEQAKEVQSGLWLLQQALNLLRTSVTNTALHSHIDNSIRNLLSINAVLRSLNIQVSYSGLRTEIQKQWLSNCVYCVLFVT